MVKLESMKLWASCRPEVLKPSANTFTTPCGVTRMIRPPKVVRRGAAAGRDRDQRVVHGIVRQARILELDADRPRALDRHQDRHAGRDARRGVGDRGHGHGQAGPQVGREDAAGVDRGDSSP